MPILRHSDARTNRSGVQGKRLKAPCLWQSCRETDQHSTETTSTGPTDGIPRFHRRTVMVPEQQVGAVTAAAAPSLRTSGAQTGSS